MFNRRLIIISQKEEMNGAAETPSVCSHRQSSLKSLHWVKATSVISPPSRAPPVYLGELPVRQINFSLTWVSRSDPPGNRPARSLLIYSAVFRHIPSEAADADGDVGTPSDVSPFVSGGGNEV